MRKAKIIKTANDKCVLCFRLLKCVPDEEFIMRVNGFTGLNVGMSFQNSWGQKGAFAQSQQNKRNMQNSKIGFSQILLQQIENQKRSGI